MAFVKSLLKTIYQMIIFLTKMFKIYYTLPTGNFSIYFDKFEWSSLFIINCQNLCDSNKQMGRICVLKLSGKTCNLQGRTADHRQVLQKVGRSVR